MIVTCCVLSPGMLMVRYWSRITFVNLISTTRFEMVQPFDFFCVLSIHNSICNLLEQLFNLHRNCASASMLIAHINQNEKNTYNRYMNRSLHSTLTHIICTSNIIQITRIVNWVDHRRFLSRCDRRCSISRTNLVSLKLYMV